MESGDSGVTSPILRVTAEISELKGNPKGRDNGKYSVSPSSTASKEGKNNLFSKKKTLHPLYGHNPYQRSNYAGSYISCHQSAKNNVSSFTQRIMSAKLLRVKQLQNQLAETQLKLNEVLNENKTLRTLQQRQDNVLKKYEGNQEQLPHLLKSHHEEIRILNEKYKQMRSSYRELENRMKQKDNELTNLREQYKHLLKLSRDKQLGDREKLTKKVEEMESIIEQQRSKIYTLEKKLSLEEKNHRYQLNQEVTKHKKTQSELNSALESINNLKAAIEAKDRFASTSYPRYQKGNVNLQLQDKGGKPSHVSLPAPPRVSIRQTQRLAQSATAMQNEDSETADSLTLNYSPVGHDSSSADSDNSSIESKDIHLNKGTLNSISKSINQKNRAAGSVQGGINITKEVFKNRRENTKPILRKESEETNKEHKNNPILLNENKLLVHPLKEDIVISHANIDENVHEGKTQKKLSDNGENMDREIAMQECIYSQNTEESLLGEIEKEVKANKSENKTEIDDDTEFEKILESTRLTDEAISELYQRDFRAEIVELEKKFQNLNKVTEKYIDEKKMSSTSIHITASENSESEEEEASKGPVPMRRKINGEVTKTILLNKAKSSEQICQQLGETEKASLLAALNNIDEADQRGSRESETLPNNNKREGILTGKIPEANSLSIYPRSKRKSDVMKDLFGIEGAIL